jgi:predicted  nucleic acid-binding Zn-ribbon protein
MKDHERSISMQCPTCGCQQFEYDENDTSDNEIIIVKCTGCEREMTKKELYDENKGTIDAAFEEMKDDVMNDIKKQFSKLFK